MFQTGLRHIPATKVHVKEANKIVNIKVSRLFIAYQTSLGHIKTSLCSICLPYLYYTYTIRSSILCIKISASMNEHTVTHTK